MHGLPAYSGFIAVQDALVDLRADKTDSLGQKLRHAKQKASHTVTGMTVSQGTDPDHGERRGQR